MNFNLSRASLNNLLMWSLLLIVTLVPFGLGGNRPMIWAVTFIALAALALIYFVGMLFLRVNMAVSISDMPVRTGLLGVFLGYCGLQVLPIAAWLPDMLVFAPAGVPNFTAISVAPSESLLAIITWLNVIFVGYFAMQAAGNDKRSHRLLNYLFWIAVLHALFAFLMFYEFDDAILFMPKWAYEGSMTGGFVNRNTFGTFLATGAVLGMTIAARALNAPRRSGWELLQIRTGILLPLVGLLVIMVALVSTTSRMGLFVGVVGMFVVLLLVWWKQPKGRSSLLAKVVLILALLGTMLTLILLYGATTLERLGTVEQSADIRMDLYKQVWQMVLSRPLTGYGGGTFELAFSPFHEAPVSYDYIWQKAHNSYLGLFADYGLVFGSIPVVILLISLLTQIRVYAKSDNTDYISIATIAVIIAAAMHAFVDFSLEIQGYALYFAAVIGAGTARTVATRSAEKVNL